MVEQHYFSTLRADAVQRSATPRPSLPPFAIRTTMAAIRIAIAVMAMLAVAYAQNTNMAPDAVAGEVIQRGPRALLAANTLGFGNVGFGTLDFSKFVDFKVVKDEKEDEKEDPKEIKIIVEKKSPPPSSPPKAEENKCLVKKEKKECEEDCHDCHKKKCVIKVYYVLEKCDDCLEKKEECYCAGKKVDCKESHDEKKVYYVETDDCHRR